MKVTLAFVLAITLLPISNSAMGKKAWQDSNVLSQCQLVQRALMTELYPENLSVLKEADIAIAKIHGGGYSSTISKDEVKSLVKLLKKVKKNNINPYYRALPKGGPISLTLWLKSDEKLTMIINGDHFLFAGNQIYQPEFCEFVITLSKNH